MSELDICKFCGNDKQFHGLGCPDTDGLVSRLEAENKRLKEILVAIREYAVGGIDEIYVKFVRLAIGDEVTITKELFKEILEILEEGEI